MKNLKYAALAALLLSSMTAGCNSSWNPFRKKEVAPEPPIVNVATMDNTGLGDPIRPDTVVQPPVVVPSDPITVAPPADESTYTIQKKDTLWSIAVRYLGDGQRYRDILAANPGLDAKKLPIGKTINLPPK